MMSRGRRILTTRTEIPTKQAEGIWHLVAPILAEYHRQQMVCADTLTNYSEPFTLKQLVISAYTQGLMDAMQLVETGRVTAEWFTPNPAPDA